MRNTPKPDLGRQKTGDENARELRDKKGNLLIADSPLLNEVFKLKGGEETEQELECRFLLARVPTEGELTEYTVFDIKQVYAFANDEKGENRRFRFRTTSQIGKKDELSVVYKNKNAFDELKGKKGPLVSQEHSIAFSRSNEEESDAVREFDALSALSEPGWLPIEKTRYEKEYELPLPGRKHVKIHLDMHRGHLAGLGRVEIEFKNLEDAIEIRERHGRGEKVLPDWIGEDVTDDPRYGSTLLATHGIPDDTPKIEKLDSSAR